jgi:hypothetical protein
VAAFGDSFTYGDEVATRDSWPARLEALDAGLEVLNYGVPGYGLDQALLRYRREGAALHPALVLLGVVFDDISRNLTGFRPFAQPATRLPFAKPRFRLQQGGLAPVGNPLPRAEDYAALLHDERATLLRLGRDDYFVRRGYQPARLELLPSVRAWTLAAWQIRSGARGRDWVGSDGSLHPGSMAFALAARLIEEFAAAVRRDGARPLLVFLPERADLRRVRSGREARYLPMLAHLRRRGIPCLDLADAVARAGADLFLLQHYSARANAAVAAALLPHARR